MPRNSRIQMVGKRERWEREAREEELRELERSLCRQWRLRRDDLATVGSSDHDEPSGVVRS